MRWNKKYNYPISSRATEDGIRRYLLGETKLPSVTSILDATKSEEDKAALQRRLLPIQEKQFALSADTAVLNVQQQINKQLQDEIRARKQS